MQCIYEKNNASMYPTFIPMNWQNFFTYTVIYYIGIKRDLELLKNHLHCLFIYICVYL